MAGLAWYILSDSPGAVDLFLRRSSGGLHPQGEPYPKHGQSCKIRQKVQGTWPGDDGVALALPEAWSAFRFRSRSGLKQRSSQRDQSAG